MTFGVTAGGLDVTAPAILGIVLAVLAAAAIAYRRGRGRPARDDEAAEALQDRLWHLAESEERYRALVEATTQAVVQRDRTGRITFASEAFARLFGVDPDMLVGSTATLQVLERGAVSVRPDGVRQVEERVLPVDGTPRWFSFVEMAAAGADGMDWLRAGCDITERIEAIRSLDEARSRAEGANTAKSRFLATVSHEFRTPLNGILGMADLVLGTGLDPEQRTYVEAVRTSGTALLTLIDGILDFSRIEAGRIDLAAEPFDVAALAEGVVELLAPRAQDKGLEIAIDIHDDLPKLRIGDADRVRQILTNLAGNAVKFTASGGVGVTVAGAEGAVVLTVEDTGPGMAQARIPTLFEEFEQGDDSASRRHEGTGLGLAITRRLVERMQGRIEATSTLGRGSTFRVVLPLPAADAQPAGTAMPSLTGRRVLIVADSAFQAPALARRLVRSGAAAVVVPDAESGVSALDGAGFDALIADRSLGDAALDALAAQAQRRGVRCSLVLLSPFDRRAFGAPGVAGFDSYLIKPVRTRSLFDRLLEPGIVRHEPAIDAPAAEAPPALAQTAPQPQPQPQPQPSGVRVLLAEDNPINALLATKALERLGAEVVLARDGVEAVALFTAHASFDVGLIDIRMPGLDGLETARRIRAIEADTGATRLYLVALTANTGLEDERAAREAGFDGFLAKPLDLKALPALLEWQARAA